MKRPKLGDYLTWNGDLAKIIGTSSGEQVIIELLDNQKCPHCEGDLGKHQFTMIVSSPLFQESAQPLQTIDK